MYYSAVADCPKRELSSLEKCDLTSARYRFNTLVRMRRISQSRNREVNVDLGKKNSAHRITRDASRKWSSRRENLDVGRGSSRHAGCAQSYEIRKSHFSERVNSGPPPGDVSESDRTGAVSGFDGRAVR